MPEQQFRVFNRNKKLLTLDLKTSEGTGRKTLRNVEEFVTANL